MSALQFQTLLGKISGTCCKQFFHILIQKLHCTHFLTRAHYVEKLLLQNREEKRCGILRHTFFKEQDVQGPFTNYLQIACHKAKIKEETHAGYQNQIFPMFFDEIQIIFTVLVHFHYVQNKIRICMLIYSTVICHKRILRQNHF